MNYYNYFTEIEEHFVKRRGKHLWVSPLDWSLIATWRDSCIPLHIALRGIDSAMDSYFARPHQSISKVNTLFYCHDSVMSEYASYLESRVGESSEEDAKASAAEKSGPDEIEGPDKKSVLAFLEAKIEEIKALHQKQSLVGNAAGGLARVLERLIGIMHDLEDDQHVDFESLEHDLAILDETLVSELRGAIPPERMTEWEQEAKKDLKIYRKRLPKETYAKILENFLRSKIHQWFGLGELSLFHL